MLDKTRSPSELFSYTIYYIISFGIVTGIMKHEISRITFYTWFVYHQFLSINQKKNAV